MKTISTIEHHCFDENGRLFCIVYLNRYNHWMMLFPSRNGNGSREAIPNPDAARQWVAALRHGKVSTWQKVDADVTIKRGGQ